MATRRLTLLILALSISVLSIQAQSSRLLATAEANTIYIAFDLRPSTLADLDVRLATAAPTVVTWIVDIKRQALLRDRPIARGLIRVVARRADGPDTFLLTRRVNGVMVDENVSMDRKSALSWLTSFPRLSVFERYQLDDQAPHKLTISAVVEGGGQQRIETSPLARADLVWR